MPQQNKKPAQGGIPNEQAQLNTAQIMGYKLEENNQNRKETSGFDAKSGSFLPVSDSNLPIELLEAAAFPAGSYGLGVFVPYWFLQLGLTPIEQHVLARVLSFYLSAKNDPTGNKPMYMCLSSYKLADQLGISQRWADKALKHLEQLGYITAERPWQKDGKERPDRRPVKYTFNVRTCVYAAMEAGYDFGMTLDNGSDYKPWLRDDYHDHKTAGKE